MAEVKIITGRDGVQYAERNGAVCRLDVSLKKEFSQQEHDSPQMTQFCQLVENPHELVFARTNGRC